jgi:hypothetical protein
MRVSNPSSRIPVRAFFPHAQSSAKKLALNQTPVITVTGLTPDTQHH